MPEALTKKMFGLPRWAWLIILAAAIGVGLYLRHKHAQEEAEQEAQPSEEAPVGVTAVESVPLGMANEGEGGSYFYGAGGGGYYGYPEGLYPEAQEKTSEHEIHIEVESVPSATDGHEIPTGVESTGTSGKPCNSDPIKPPKGYKAECVSGHWKIVPIHKHDRPAPGGPPGVKTGGGPPDKRKNHGPSIGNAQPVGNPGTPTAVAHPQAVDTGNACVNGGVGKHTAPPGYHLFCGSNGHIWRAPNS